MYLNDFVKKILDTDDYSKLILWMPKFLLTLVHLWPEIKNQNRKRVVFCLFICMLLFVSYGVFRFIHIHFYQIDKSSAAFSSLSNIFQGMSKTILIYYYSDRFKKVLQEIWDNFWPSTIDEDIHEDLKNRYLLLTKGIFAFVGSTSLFLVGFLIVPLAYNLSNHPDKSLPFLSVYPFEWQFSPVWEILYILHCIVDLYVIPVTVFGFDFLFVGLCFVIMTQYIILRNVISSLGTKNMETFIMKIDKDATIIDGDDVNTTKEFLKMCVEHHNRLLRVIQEVESIFNIASLLQLTNSVIAMCVASFVTTTTDVSIEQAAVMISYLAGYFTQLAVYCFIGNELYHESITLPNFIFGSKWYDIDNSIKKDLILVIKGAQVPAKVTAFKFFEINFPTFIGVLRLSFSFYTLLSTVAIK